MSATPEQYLKFQIKSALNMAGAGNDEITLDRYADAVWVALVNAETEVYWHHILVDLQIARQAKKDAED